MHGSIRHTDTTPVPDENESRRVANLLGATALAVTDDLLAGPVAAAATSMSGAAALIVLEAGPGVSVTELGRRVGLTQSAAVRMVDALERDGLVERHRTANKWTWVRPTPRGSRTAHALLDGRGERLTALLDGLAAEQVRALGELLEQVLASVYRDRARGPEPAVAHHRICRLCDRSACTRTADCPVGAEERAATERRAAGERPAPGDRPAPEDRPAPGPP